MYTFKKLRLILSILSLAFTIVLMTPTITKAKGSSDKGSKGSKGSDDKGSCDKGSKGSKGSDDKGSSDKGSKGSCNTPPVIVVTTGTVCGTVYNDSNENGVQDTKEVGTNGIIIIITDINGNITKTATNKDGTYCAKNIVEGLTLINVLENTLPTNTLLTAGENPNEITTVGGQTNQAGKDGYTVISNTGGSDSTQI